MGQTESSINIHALPCVKWVTSGKLRYSTGIPFVTRGGEQVLPPLGVLRLGGSRRQRRRVTGEQGWVGEGACSLPYQWMVRKRPQTIPGQPSTQKDKAGTDQMPCARLSKVQSRHELRDPGQPSRTSRGAGLTGTPVPRARQRARVHPRCYGCWYPHPVNHELLQPRAACGPSSSPRAAVPIS